MYEELREKCFKCSHNISEEGAASNDPNKYAAIFKAIDIIYQLIFTSEIEDIFAQGLLREGLKNALIGSVKIL